MRRGEADRLGYCMDEPYYCGSCEGCATSKAYDVAGLGESVPLSELSDEIAILMARARRAYA